ncbi:unnamed protein product, partial [Trichogramma brassicae]
AFRKNIDRKSTFIGEEEVATKGEKLLLQRVDRVTLQLLRVHFNEYAAEASNELLLDDSIHGYCRLHKYSTLEFLIELTPYFFVQRLYVSRPARGDDRSGKKRINMPTYKGEGREVHQSNFFRYKNFYSDETKSRLKYGLTYYSALIVHGYCRLHKYSTLEFLIELTPYFFVQRLYVSRPARGDDRSGKKRINMPTYKGEGREVHQSNFFRYKNFYSDETKSRLKYGLTYYSALIVHGYCRLHKYSTLEFLIELTPYFFVQRLYVSRPARGDDRSGKKRINMPTYKGEGREVHQSNFFRYKNFYSDETKSRLKYGLTYYSALIVHGYCRLHKYSTLEFLIELTPYFFVQRLYVSRPARGDDRSGKKRINMPTYKGEGREVHQSNFFRYKNFYSDETKSRLKYGLTYYSALIVHGYCRLHKYSTLEFLIELTPYFFVQRLYVSRPARVKLPPVRFELTTPGLRDQCSTTELKRPTLMNSNLTILQPGLPLVYHTHQKLCQRQQAIFVMNNWKLWCSEEHHRLSLGVCGSTTSRKSANATFYNQRSTRGLFRSHHVPMINTVYTQTYAYSEVCSSFESCRAPLHQSPKDTFVVAFLCETSSDSRKQEKVYNEVYYLYMRMIITDARSTFCMQYMHPEFSMLARTQYEEGAIVFLRLSAHRVSSNSNALKPARIPVLGTTSATAAATLLLLIPQERAFRVKKMFFFYLLPRKFLDTARNGYHELLEPFSCLPRIRGVKYYLKYLSIHVNNTCTSLSTYHSREPPCTHYICAAYHEMIELICIHFNIHKEDTRASVYVFQKDLRERYIAFSLAKISLHGISDIAKKCIVHYFDLDGEDCSYEDIDSAMMKEFEDTQADNGSNISLFFTCSRCSQVVNVHACICSAEYNYDFYDSDEVASSIYGSDCGYSDSTSLDEYMSTTSQEPNITRLSCEVSVDPPTTKISSQTKILSGGGIILFNDCPPTTSFDGDPEAAMHLVNVQRVHIKTFSSGGDCLVKQKPVEEQPLISGKDLESLCRYAIIFLYRQIFQMVSLFFSFDTVTYKSHLICYHLP